MRPIRFVPQNTRFDFVRWRLVAFVFTAIILLASVGGLVFKGLNLGIDFEGGLLMEVRSEETVDIGEVRSQLGALGLDGINLQEFGNERDLLIRVQLPEEGGEEAQQAVVDQIRSSLGEGYDYRRVEFVGPTVGAELLRDGILATGLAVLAIAAYVAFRFEWQFGVSALIATFHDVFTAVGLFALLGLEFDMTAIAALLTLAGYSINDTVVVFDRIRESLRKQKKADLRTLINASLNETLSRTILTGGTTLVAVLSLLFFGGPTLFNFSLALAWGIVIGTFSSIFVAAALLLYMPPVGGRATGLETDDAGPAPATVKE